MARLVSAAILLAFCQGAHGLKLAEAAAPTLDIVVAAGSKNLQGVTQIMEALPNARLRLYCWGAAIADPRCSVRELRGSPEYMMLRHIVDGYDRGFADVTVFLHDKPRSTGLAGQVFSAVNTPQKRANFSGFYAPQYLRVKWADDRAQDSCRASVKTFGLWYRWFVNPQDSKLARVKCAGAPVDSLFAVAAHHLRRWPRKVYEDLLREVGRCNGEAGNMPGGFLSWSWAAMYSQECHAQEAPAAEQLPAGAPRALLSAQAKTQERSLDLVVASYKAPLGWIDEVRQEIPQARLFLYCKHAGNQDPRCLHMENVGTEEYVYLNHILKNWDNLADITIFSIDNMDNIAYKNPSTRECLEYVVSKVDAPKKRADFSGYEALDFNPVTQRFDIETYFASALPGESLEKQPLCPASVQPFGPWYLKYINASDPTFSRMNCAGSSMHGIFATTREQIRRWPKSVFEGLVREVERCRGVNHFVTGHYMERSWSILFTKQCHTVEAHLNLARRQARTTEVLAGQREPR